MPGARSDQFEDGGAPRLTHSVRTDSDIFMSLPGGATGGLSSLKSGPSLATIWPGSSD
jgi:hypothetical protein